MTLEEFRRELQLPVVSSTTDIVLRVSFALARRLGEIVDWGSSCYHKLDEINQTLKTLNVREPY